MSDLDGGQEEPCKTLMWYSSRIADGRRKEERVVRISIDTDEDTFENALKAILAAYGESLPTSAVVSEPPRHDDDDEDDDEDGYLPGRWTRARVKKLVEWLGHSDAAVAVRYMAENAPAVSLDSTFEHMAERTGIEGFDGRAMGGRMSAVGFARNHIGGGVQPIYDVDYNARKYRMNTKLAAAILEAMDAFEEQ